MLRLICLITFLIPFQLHANDSELDKLKKVVAIQQTRIAELTEILNSIIDSNKNWIGEPTGLRGPKGVQGIQGPKGDTGPAGSNANINQDSCRWVSFGAKNHSALGAGTEVHAACSSGEYVAGTKHRTWKSAANYEHGILCCKAG